MWQLQSNKALVLQAIKGSKSGSSPLSSQQGRTSPLAMGTSGITAANIQAAAQYAKQSAIRAFTHAVVFSCQAQNALVSTFVSNLMSQPTLVIRHPFNTSCVIARMSMDLIEVFPCRKVKSYKVVKMTDCGVCIPVIYEVRICSCPPASYYSDSSMVCLLSYK